MMRPLRALLSIAAIPFTTPLLALSVTINIMSQDHCGYGDGRLSAEASGGVPPYTYNWSNGSTQQAIWNLPAGTYSVTVTDANLDQATANGTVIVVDHSDQFEFLSGDAYCPDGLMSIPFFRWTPVENGGNYGPEPWTFNGEIVPQDLGVTQQPLYNVPIWGDPGQQVAMQFMDAEGCTGDFYVIAGYPVEWPVTSILQINGTCSGGSIGSVFVGYTSEGHNYSVATEVRNMQDQIVIQGGYEWHGAGGPATQLFAGLAAGDYRLIQRLTMAEGSLYYDWCSDETFVTIPDLGTGCGNVNGTVYMDYNEDCVMGVSGSETRVPGALIEFTPGPSYATANSAGVFTIDLADGAYMMQQIATGIAQHCPAPPAAVSVSGGVQTINIADTALVPLDARVMIASGPARPGFELHYGIEQDNLSPATTGNTSTVMTFDPAVSFIAASPAPTNVAGNTLTWNQNALGAFQYRSIQVRFQVPPDVGLIGAVLSASVSLTTTNTDAVPINNSAGTSVTVTGSFDPNDKQARTSSGYSNELYFIDQDEYIDYTIRFQNTGTDTAFSVIITDTLPATLDPATIAWGASSHACMRSLTGQGVLKFIFPNILLPDSNVNEAASHGFVSFRIRPHLSLLPGTVIENTANIFFDFNPPVITEPSVLVAEFSTGMSIEANAGEWSVGAFPSPATDHLVVMSIGGPPIERVELLTSDGRSIRSLNLMGARVVVSIGDLASGMYLLRVSATDGAIRMVRFTK